MKSFVKTAVMSVALIALAGCATTEKVATNQIGDENLSCEQIKTQNVKLDELAEKAEHNKGVNTANVAAVLFFWPAAVGNYMDADTAEKLIDKRRTKLASLYAEKQCKV